MKVYLQICDEGRKFKVKYDEEVTYGVFEFVPQDPPSLAWRVDSVAHPKWMKTHEFFDSLELALSNYIARNVVDLDDGEWIEHVVEPYDLSQHNVVGRKYQFRGYTGT